MASLNPLQGALGQRQAAHLLRRTSFRFTKAKVDEMAGQTAAKALDSLLKLYPLQSDQPIYKLNDSNPGVTWVLPLPGAAPAGVQDFVLQRYVMSWWTNEALYDPGIGHKMTFFFHQYMTLTANSFGSAHFFDYLSLMRWGALGNFKKLALKVVTDNCMLRYLNNQQNRKGSPNENFAREFFELFTILKGPQAGPGDYTNYTEDDIVQAAKVFTGFRVWGNRDNVDPETGIPRGDIGNPTPPNSGITNLHETTPKTFSARFGGKTIQGGNSVATVRQELSSFVDMIFAQPETARNLCRRLYRYFVDNNITAEIETDVIQPLATLLVSNNFEVRPVLEKLLQSQHFFDADDSNSKDETVGSMIKSPIELTYQAMSFFNMAPPDIKTKPYENFQFHNRFTLQRMFGQANLPLFYPSDVAGYPAYHQEPDYTHQWFNSSTIITRYKLGETLLNGMVVAGINNVNINIRLRVEDWLKTSGFVSDPSDAYVLVKELLGYLLPEEVDIDRFEYFYNEVFLDKLPPSDWTYEWQNYIATGNATEVRIPLGRLVKAILYSPEYQTL